MAVRKDLLGLSRDYIIHPGETLAEVIEDRKMSQKDLAVRTGMSEKHISTVIHGKKDISATFAKKLEYALGIESAFWINLQANYNRELIDFEELNNITEAELKILKNLKEVIDIWTSFGWLNIQLSPAAMVLDIRKILCISNLLDIPKISYAAAYRVNNKNAHVDIYVLFAWQRMCELLTKDIDIANEINIEKLRNRISEIKEVMFMPDAQIQDKLSTIFSECGIAFKVVPNFTGAPVQGFIKTTEDGILILCITLRQKFADIFWFTLFHEIAHILNGDMKHEFIDFDSVPGEMEMKADSMAADFLINPKEYKMFIDSQGYKCLNGVANFAASQHVKDYIIQGRLMRDGKINWNARTKYEWS